MQAHTELLRAENNSRATLRNTLYIQLSNKNQNNTIEKWADSG